MKYDKLVRDKIPEIIRRDGKIPITHIANDKEFWEKLKEKLKEEADEFIENDNEEELGDILEIIYSICYFKNINEEELEINRKKKAQERGGFSGRVILDETN